jgi:hypothetical protein
VPSISGANPAKMQVKSIENWNKPSIA